MQEIVGEGVGIQRLHPLNNMLHKHHNHNKQANTHSTASTRRSKCATASPAQPATTPASTPSEVQPIEKFNGTISSWLQGRSTNMKRIILNKKTILIKRMSLEQIAPHALRKWPNRLPKKERQHKRERSRAILSAIGDGVSALSNLRIIQ